MPLDAPTAHFEATSVSGKQVPISLACADPGEGLRRYQLFVNEVPILGPAGKPVQGHHAVVEETVELGRGENKIEDCTTAAGHESLRALASSLPGAGTP